MAPKQTTVLRAAKRMAAAIAMLAAGLALAACGGDRAGADGEDGGLSGMIQIDGSSTVYPITQAMAEEFQLAHGGDVRVTVGVSGTGGGFERFCRGETAISGASREIKPSELEACRGAGIEPVEIPVALDGITVVVNPHNDWAECMTVEELRRLWRPGSTIERWSQIRPEWPEEPIALFGPGTDSGTFDYFTEAIVGEEDASRADYTASEDDNVLVIGVQGNRYALGYFGFAYYEENRERLKAVAIDAGGGCVPPTRQTIQTREYAPLSRPLYIYVAEDALRRPEVRAFVEFYLENAPELVPLTGYVPLPDERYRELLSEIPDGTAAGEGAGGDTAPPAEPSDTGR